MLTINSVDCMLRISAVKAKTLKELPSSGMTADGRSGLHVPAPFLKPLSCIIGNFLLSMIAGILGTVSDSLYSKMLAPSTMLKSTTL